MAVDAVRSRATAGRTARRWVEGALFEVGDADFKLRDESARVSAVWRFRKSAGVLTVHVPADLARRKGRTVRRPVREDEMGERELMKSQRREASEQRPVDPVQRCL